MLKMNSVKVAVRVRPLISRENGDKVYWTHDTRAIKSDGRKDPYVFDRVFGSDEETKEVYNEIVAPIVDEAMKGFNGTVFAYGQTSSGKTYTMMGSPDRNNPGIIPMVVRDTFSHIQNTPESEFLLRVSYLEIYNEVLKDLLAPASDTTKLEIHEDKNHNIVVQGLKEKPVSTEAEIFDLLSQGDKRRRVGETNMNKRSSRSHTIFRMILESRECVDARTADDPMDSEMAVKVSQLNLVDLAGSERVEQTGAEGQRFEEARHINLSLSVLRRVISQICQGSVHKSYRESPLTRILQPSLGGNTLTAIICTITPVSFFDTESTLRFASDAKKIKNKPRVNEVLSDEAVLNKQKREIKQLKKIIHELESNKKKKEERIETLIRMRLTSSQPVDIKTRGETLWPGLKPDLAGPPTINQSSLLNLDARDVGVDNVFVFPPKLSDAEADTKVQIERLLKKNDEYKQGLLEQDKELEAEQEKRKSLEQRVEELEGRLNTKETSMKTVEEHCRKLEAKYNQAKHQNQSLDNQLRAEKHRNSQLQSKVDKLVVQLDAANKSHSDLVETKELLYKKELENVTKELESATEREEMAANLAKQQNEHHESAISELQEDFQKKLSDAKADTKVRIERLLKKIDEYEQGLFEQDKELEAEQEKTKSLEQKVEELESRLNTKANPKEPSMKTVKEHCRKLEAKYDQAKHQNQSLDNQLRAEKHRNSQLQSKLDEFVRAAPSSKDIARELVAKRQAKDAYDAELKKIKEEHSEETKVLAERMKRVKKELNEQVTHFEDKLIESEQELDQVKEKNEKLEAELGQMKSRPNAEADKELKKALHGKEREVSRLEIQLEHAKEPLQRENGRLKEELKVCEERIENLKQRVKMAAAGKASAERPQSRVWRATRSGAAASQSGAPLFDSQMCLLEMEVSDYKFRNDLLQSELDKCRDIEKKIMSENMELRELNNHYRSLIKKAREKNAAGGAEVLTENTAIPPYSAVAQDDKCKQQ